MTNQEAIKYLENHGYISDDVKDMAIKALEKPIPKKPIEIKINGDEFCYACPTCSSINLLGGFCNDCCQKIDWSEKE